MGRVGKKGREIKEVTVLWVQKGERKTENIKCREVNDCKKNLFR